MKRFSIVFAVFALFLTAGTAALAVFPTPDTSVTVTLKQGYYENALVWFFCTDTNDINFSSTNQFPYRILTFAPLLTSAYDYDPLDPTDGAIVFVNTGYQQGPLFTAVPTQDDYSGIWSVVFIKWLPGKARQVTNTAAPGAGNIAGFPILTGLLKEADLVTTYGTSKSDVVVDCPIVAVGPLDNGVWQRDNVDPTTLYRLPQVIDIDFGDFNKTKKTVKLPAWYAYCQERFPDSPAPRFYIDRCTVIIPDVEDYVLADRLGANRAPGLDDIDVDNSQDFFYIDGWLFGDGSFITGGPPGILAAVNQYPVLEWAPNGMGIGKDRNTNRAYTPVMDFTILEGGASFPFTPANKKVVFVNNWSYLDTILIPGLVYTEVPDHRVNAPITSFIRIGRK